MDRRCRESEGKAKIEGYMSVSDEEAHQCSQALSITSPYAHFLVFHSYLTCLYLPFAQNITREEPHTCLYQSPSELRFSTYASHS